MRCAFDWDRSRSNDPGWASDIAGLRRNYSADVSVPSSLWHRQRCIRGGSRDYALGFLQKGRVCGGHVGDSASDELNKCDRCPDPLGTSDKVRGIRDSDIACHLQWCSTLLVAETRQLEEAGTHVNSNNLKSDGMSALADGGYQIDTCSLRQMSPRRDRGIHVIAHRPSPKLYPADPTTGRHSTHRNPTAPFPSSTSDPP